MLCTINENVERELHTHYAKWSSCAKCSLCDKRRNVVLARGYFPCHLLFIGEAPGAFEDLTSFPFVGQAGCLLEKIWDEAKERVKQEYGPVFGCFTNIVACIPKHPVGGTQPPTEGEINACRPRLHDLIKIAKPRGIILVGSESKDHLKDDPVVSEIPHSTIIHPAALLRANDSSIFLPEYRRSLSTIVNLIRKTCEVVA